MMMMIGRRVLLSNDRILRFCEFSSSSLRRSRGGKRRYSEKKAEEELRRMSESRTKLTRTKLSESLKVLTKDRKNHKFVVERCSSILSQNKDTVQDSLNKTSINCILKAAFRYDSDPAAGSKVYAVVLFERKAREYHITKK